MAREVGTTWAMAVTTVDTTGVTATTGITATAGATRDLRGVLQHLRWFVPLLWLWPRLPLRPLLLWQWLPPLRLQPGSLRAASGRRRAAPGRRRASAGRRRAAPGRRRAAAGRLRASAGRRRAAAGSRRPSPGRRPGAAGRRQGAAGRRPVGASRRRDAAGRRSLTDPIPASPKSLRSHLSWTEGTQACHSSKSRAVSPSASQLADVG